MNEERRTILGPTFSDIAPTSNKILAADGLPGVFMMLAYYAGGDNLFPPEISPEMYLLPVEDEAHRGCVRTDKGLVTELLRSLSLYLGQEMGQLGSGSLKIYVSLLNNGYRANRTGRFPPVRVEVREKREVADLIIHPRNLAQDRANQLWNLVPSWVKAISEA